MIKSTSQGFGAKWRQLPPGVFLVLCALISVAVIIAIGSTMVAVSNASTDAESAVEDDDSAGPATGLAQSESCVDTIREAAAIPADADANEPLIRSASTCQTVEEWVSAVRLYPESMGLTDPAMVDPEFDLVGICGISPSSPVCVDATRLGLDTYWG